MTNGGLRPPRDADWPAILELANRSVANVPGAGPQDAWLANRHFFPPDSGVQHHWVAEEPTSLEVAGYAAIESQAGADDGAFRIFVVTETTKLATLGETLLDHALGKLAELRAKSAYFTEYAAGTELVAFVLGHGFAEARRFDFEEGREAVVLTRSLELATGA